MKRKFIFLLILSAMIINNNIYAENATADSDEVVIDLNDNTMTSERGVVVTNGNMKGLFYKLQRDPVTGEITFTNNALMNISQPTGNIKIETEGGKVSQKDEKGEFYNSFAYINVAKMTGAEAPNDKIYFGSPYIKYEDEKIYAKDAWVTTDFNIVNFQKEPQKAGYHIFSSDVIVEPDKQITLKKSDLFIGEKDVMPFTFPWFRANIRSGSTVPLFITIQSDDDYGAATSMGFLYGNRRDKFRGGFAPKFADKMGIKYISTGHYSKKSINGLLIWDKENRKDQSYMLYRLNKDIVERFLFPLSEYEKPQVREIARQHGIHTHNKPDSQGICFAPDGYIPYLQKVLGNDVQKGNYVDKEGNIIGQHMGYQFYTIGQRRGLGLNLGRPFFVSEIRPETNEIVVGDFEELLIDEIEVINYKLYYELEELLDKEIIARPRFSSKGLKGKLVLKDSSLHFKFNEKTHENSEGQHIVFYLNDELIGGGEIKTGK